MRAATRLGCIIIDITAQQHFVLTPHTAQLSPFRLPHQFVLCVKLCDLLVSKSQLKRHTLGSHKLSSQNLKGILREFSGPPVWATPLNHPLHVMNSIENCLGGIPAAEKSQKISIFLKIPLFVSIFLTAARAKAASSINFSGNNRRPQGDANRTSKMRSITWRNAAWT